MCGFAGIYTKNTITDSQRQSCAAMSEAIAHRGPDESREIETDRTLFGFRRLSIIDLAGGSQPFVTEDGRYSAVYNGEVYNYLELKRALESEGVVFRTNSEIEVMLMLYRREGAKFIEKLRGMFAFLIYDNVTKTLMAGRDPFGIKPLYYRETADGIIFASEIKAFKYDSSYDGFKVNKKLLQNYLTFQYVTEPDTITGDIFILPKGSYMLYKDKPEIVGYYKPVFKPDRSRTYDQKKKALRDAIENSVAAHMLSDVPVGSFLSSGIDSAVITALASKISPGIKAFTVGFNVKGYSELRDAEQISAHLDIEHILLECTIEDFIDSYEKVIYHLDSPLADPSVCAIYLISREAARHVKVVLSGEGSDELFGGYRQYASAIPTSRIYALPSPVKTALMKLAYVLPEHVKGRGLIIRGCTPIEKRFVGNSFVFAEKEKKSFLKTFEPSVRYTDRTAAIYAEHPEYSTLLKMQHCDMNTWLPSDILVKGDRLSMAHSLEARVPFLDKEVFKAASALCDRDKISHNTTKYILRDAFSDLVNPETVKRAKLGYPVPVRVWLRNELYDWAKNIIKNSTATEYIDSAAALKLLEDHRKGVEDYYHQLWVILTFITWHKLYIANP